MPGLSPLRGGGAPGEGMVPGPLPDYDGDEVVRNPGLGRPGLRAGPSGAAPDRAGPLRATYARARPLGDALGPVPAHRGVRRGPRDAVGGGIPVLRRLYPY